MKTTGLQYAGAAFGEVPVRPILGRPANGNAPAEDFWPEVSGRYSSEYLTPPDTDNSPHHGLLEVLLVVGAVVLVSLAAILWGPLLS